MTDRDISVALRMIETTLAALLSERAAERREVRTQLKELALYAVQEAIELEDLEPAKPV